MHKHIFEATTPSRVARIALLIALVGAAGVAQATLQRTFVASYGNDANPCNLPLPCRTFGVAIALTNSGGEVIVLDAAGYGAFTIAQPVSIIAPAGVYAGITVFAGTGVTVNAAGGIVTLRGLTINSLGGSIGIDYVAAARLYVDDTIVTGFGLTAASAGVRATLGASGNLNLRNSAVRDSATGLLGSTSSGTLTVDVEGTAFEGNDVGIDLRDGTAGVVRNSTFTDGTTGITAHATTAAKTSQIEVRRALIADNGVGLQSGQAAASPTFVSLISSLVTGNTTGVQATANPVYCSDNTISRNTTGLSLVTGGTGQTAQDNAVANNGASAAFTSVVPKL